MRAGEIQLLEAPSTCSTTKLSEGEGGASLSPEAMDTQLDEGYSEAPLAVGALGGSAGSLSWVQSLSVDQRTGK